MSQNELLLKAREILIANHLSGLLSALGSRRVIMAGLQAHFTQLERGDSPVPNDLQWLYNQYKESKI